MSEERSFFKRSAEGDLAVLLCNSITARVIVWIAVVLIPARALPVMACDCLSYLASPAQADAVGNDTTSVAACPHCRARARLKHSCCKSKSVNVSKQRTTSCGARASSACCCGGLDGTCTHGASCHCSAKGSVPAPAPLPSDSRTDNTKLSSASPSDAVTTVVVAPSTSLTRQAAQRPSLLGATPLERLTTLCRLVI